MVNETNINSLDAFVQAVKDFMLMEYQVPDIRINKVSKNNGVILTGLCIMKPDNNVVPNIYLDGFYEAYQNGKSMDEVVKEILRINEENQITEPLCINPLTSFDTVKDKVVYRLVNKERNRNRLHNIPYIDYMDLAIIFCIVMDEIDNGIATLTVTNDMLDDWNFSTEELYALAHKNTVKRFPVSLKNIKETLLAAVSDLDITDTEIEECSDAVPMYVVTNTTQLNGASVVLYENQLKEFSKCLGGDYFLLPSSIHETLLIPVTNEMNNPSDLKEMVVDVNENCVRDEEFLSDSVYRYFVDEDCLKIVA